MAVAVGETVGVNVVVSVTVPVIEDELLSVPEGVVVELGLGDVDGAMSYSHM